MYKMVVLDIDGTTLTDDEKLTKENLRAIQECVKMGVPVCLCTGRNVHNTKRVSNHLKVDTPYVCIDGTIIFDTKNKKYIKDELIPMDMVKDILNIVDEEDLYVELCTGEKYIKYCKNDALAKYNYLGVPENIQRKYVDYFIRRARYVKNINSYKAGKHNLNQIIFAGDKEVVAKVKEIINNKNYEGLEIKDDLWDNYVFISPKNCRKLDGVKALCNHYNIELDEVIAIGDQMNDYDMINGVGLGVAMGNATEKIKEIADFVTLDNNNSGVAHVIDKFILNK